MNRIFLLLVVLYLLPPALAQQSSHHHMATGDDLGSVSFPTSCSPATQNDFQRAVAMLHSFAYEDALATFADVARQDPDCGIAYWGEAMSYYHQIWEPPDSAHLKKGFEASQKAMAIGAGTAREKDYIAAVSAFYKDWTRLDHLTRARKYQVAMARLYATYPDDREAAVFYALSLIALASHDDPSYPDQRKAGAILEKVFAEQPQHPGVAHYIIHAYDNPGLANQALNAARRYAQIAPSSVHALHMPSHIFIQVGSWQEAIDSNLASIAAARKYSARNHLSGLWDMEAHAQDYLSYAYLQVGRDKDAKHVLDEVSAAHDQRTGESPAAAYSAFAGIPARYALERGQWAEAAALKQHGFPSPIQEAETAFARAMGCARIGDVGCARDARDYLATLRKNVGENATRYTNADFIKIQQFEAAAWLAEGEHNHDEGVRLMQAAVDLEKSTLATWVPAPLLPASEQLGDLLLELNRPKEALVAFESSLVITPNRFNGLYGAARAAELSGNVVKAKTYYTNLVENCKGSESDRQELTAARAFLQKQNLAEIGR